MLSSHNYSLHPHSGVLCTNVPHSSIKHSIHFVVPVSLAEKHEHSYYNFTFTITHRSIINTYLFVFQR